MKRRLYTVKGCDTGCGCTALARRLSAIAVAYGASGCSLLFKVATTSFMDRGADLAWCSAFPGESECLFPPLTYLQPTGRREVVRLGDGGAEFTVVEVAPHFPS